MDLQGKPTYQVNECIRCKEWQEDDRKARETKGRPPCRKCKKGILLYLYVPQGFRSLEVDHWHFRAVEGVNGASAVMPCLCWDCYIKEWESRYSKMEGIEKPNPPQRLV